MGYTEPREVYTAEELTKLVNADHTIHASVTVRGEYLREIVGVEKIDGSLVSADSKLESFGTLKEVTGDIWFSIHTVAPLIISMGEARNGRWRLELKGSEI